MEAQATTQETTQVAWVEDEDNMIVQPGGENTEAGGGEGEGQGESGAENTETTEATATESTDKNPDEKPTVAPAEENPATPPPPPSHTPPQRSTTEPNTPVDLYAQEGLTKEQADFAKLALKAIKAGDFDNFARIRATDWDKMGDIDMVRLDAEEKYKGLAPEKREIMVKRELAKYDPSTFDEDDRTVKEIELELHASELRDRRKAQQAQYQIPESGPSTEQIEAQQKQQAAAATFEKQVLSDPALTDFETKKVIKLGTGDNAFNYAAEKFDARQALQKGVDVITYDEQGLPVKMDVPKFLKAALFATHGDDIANKLIEHGKMLGRKAAEAELRNPGRRPATSAPTEGGDDVIVGPYRRH